MEEVLIVGDTTLHLRITNINQISLLEEIVDTVGKLNLNVAGTPFDAQTLMAPHRRIIGWQDSEYVFPRLVDFRSLEEISITGDNENQMLSVLAYMLTCEEVMALSRLQIEGRTVEPAQLIGRIREQRVIWEERFIAMFLQSFAEIVEVTPSREEIRVAQEAEAERTEAERIADQRRETLGRIDRAERLAMDEVEQALCEVEQALFLQIIREDLAIVGERDASADLVVGSGFNPHVLRELSIVLPECQELSLAEAREVYRDLPGLHYDTRTILLNTLADDALYLNPELTIIRKNELRHIARVSRDRLRAEEDIGAIRYYLNQGFSLDVCHLGQDEAVYMLIRNLDLVRTTVPIADPGSPEMAFENALKLAIHKVRSVSLERLKTWGVVHAAAPDHTANVTMRIQRLIYQHFGGAAGGAPDPYLGGGRIGVVLLDNVEQTDRDIIRHFIARCGFRVEVLLHTITAELNREDLVTAVRSVFMNILSTREPGVEFDDMVDRMREMSGLTVGEPLFDDVRSDASRMRPAPLTVPEMRAYLSMRDTKFQILQ